MEITPNKDAQYQPIERDSALDERRMSNLEILMVPTAPVPAGTLHVEQKIATVTTPYTSQTHPAFFRTSD